MFGKSLDLGAKRDMMGAVMFFFAHLMILVGVSTVLVHFLGMVGVVEGAGGFFDGGETFTLISSLFVLWLGGSILAKRGSTSDMMSIIIVMIGVYLAWTSGAIMGLIPIALLTTIGK
jgi:hypothetical protein